MKIAAVAALFTALGAAADSGYIDAGACAACHASIAQSYARSAMARSFSKAQSGAAVDDFYHATSATHFAMLNRAGKYYQRRWQIDFNGSVTNVEEKSVDYVMGSGAHVKTFLHRKAADELQQLPLAWYAEGRGTWAMNPGYDRVDQPDARRTIGYECMACHNAYPETPAGADRFRAQPVYSSIPEGIDCQRCHGPGRAHVERARAGAGAEAIRAAIVNPARLTADRQMDVCAQCHLETTSFAFPHSILKYDRGPFSYRPGEPLSDVFLLFDHARASPAEDRFQIVSSVYRLKMSACFLKSAGRLQCTTCHDPHAGQASADHYNGVCRQCHRTLETVANGAHGSNADCVACHMPKRRTDDVVHAILTDHYIQRRPPARDLLAAKPEPQGEATVYHGTVEPYDPAFARTPENELYLALAQVREGNNLTQGLRQFAAAIEKYQPARAEFYIEFGDALLKAGQMDKAIDAYKMAIARDGNSIAAWLGSGDALEKAGEVAGAAAAFERATALAPSNAESWRRLGEARIKLNAIAQADEALERARSLDPESAETQYALATLWAGDPARAAACYREAIRLLPAYPAAHMNLAILLARENREEEARFHFQSALRYQPDYALGHYNFALMLNARRQYPEAIRELESALRAATPLDAASRAAATRLLGQLRRR